MHNNFIAYGLSSEMAIKMDTCGLTLTTVRATSIDNLVQRYGLKEPEAREAKRLVKRDPIDSDTLQTLLERSNFRCNCCKGMSGHSYVVHHIEEYSKTQDNSYDNLIVLCPVCHDLAHNSSGLTHRISKGQLRSAKRRWEEQVERYNVREAVQQFQFHDVEYVNIPRIVELAIGTLSEIPETSISPGLIADDVLTPNRDLVPGLLGSGSGHRQLFRIPMHFCEVFEKASARCQFEDIDDLLSISRLKDPSVLGKWCFYCGGLYGKTEASTDFEAGQQVRLLLKRGPFRVRWTLDPRLIVTDTARGNLGGHSVHLVYGKITGVRLAQEHHKRVVHVDVRPYVVAIPFLTIGRKPAIAWAKEFEDYEEEAWEDDVEASEDLTRRNIAESIAAAENSSKAGIGVH